MYSVKPGRVSLPIAKYLYVNNNATGFHFISLLRPFLSYFNCTYLLFFQNEDSQVLEEGYFPVAPRIIFWHSV